MSNQCNDGAELYYILDVRSCVGNCAVWWRPDGQGYTCDLDDAGLYTKEQADGRRDTDIPVNQHVARGVSVTHVTWDSLQKAGVKTRPKR